MLSNREKCFYDKMVTEYEIPTLIGLISIEFPWTHVIVRVGDCMVRFFGLKHYGAGRTISIVQGEHFLLERPFVYFID